MPQPAGRRWLACHTYSIRTFRRTWTTLATGKQDLYVLQVAGAKALRDYVLEGQVATAGLNDIWKVYSARSRKEGALLALCTGAYKL